jgi:hypothetical protein
MKQLTITQRQTYKDFIKDYLTKHATKNWPVNSFILARELSFHFNTTVKTQKIRTLINLLRQDGVPVIANNRGYYISYEKEDIVRQIVSMKKRISITGLAINGLQSII